MKTTSGNFKVLNTALCALALTLLAAPSSYARGNSMKREFRKMFNLGMCVGQGLAAQGITLPQRQPGQRAPVLDASTQGALKGAVQQCWADIRKGQAEAQPPATPGTTPSTTPGTTPSTTTTPSTGTTPANGSTVTPAPTTATPTGN